MDVRKGFAGSLREIRLSQGMAQEDFHDISGRTYVGALERAEKSPTLDKITQLASVLDIHPLTLLTLTYIRAESHKDERALHAIVKRELALIKKKGKRLPKP